MLVDLRPSMWVMGLKDGHVLEPCSYYPSRHLGHPNALVKWPVVGQYDRREPLEYMRLAGAMPRY